MALTFFSRFIMHMSCTPCVQLRFLVIPGYFAGRMKRYGEKWRLSDRNITNSSRLLIRWASRLHSVTVYTIKYLIRAPGEGPRHTRGGGTFTFREFLTEWKSAKIWPYLRYLESCKCRDPACCNINVFSPLPPHSWYSSWLQWLVISADSLWRGNSLWC